MHQSTCCKIWKNKNGANCQISRFHLFARCHDKDLYIQIEIHFFGFVFFGRRKFGPKVTSLRKILFSIISSRIHNRSVKYLVFHSRSKENVSNREDLHVCRRNEARGPINRGSSTRKRAVGAAGTRCNTSGNVGILIGARVHAWDATRLKRRRRCAG